MEMYRGGVHIATNQTPYHGVIHVVTLDVLSDSVGRIFSRDIAFTAIHTRSNQYRRGRHPLRESIKIYPAPAVPGVKEHDFRGRSVAPFSRVVHPPFHRFSIPVGRHGDDVLPRTVRFDEGFYKG